MLDLHAAVHHDVEAGVERDPRRLVVADAELHPQHLAPFATASRAIGDDLLGLAEAVDDVDRARESRARSG